MSDQQVKLYLKLAFVVILIISIAPFLLFFKGQSFSSKLNDWADAATWFSLFVGLITTTILVYLTWRIHENENKRDKQNQDILVNLEKPTLIFYSEKGDKDIDKWYVKNIGRGPALNLAITHYPLDGTQWVYFLIDCYSLGTQDEPLQLKWLNKTRVSKLVVFYDDNLSDTKHISIGYSDKTEIRNTKEFKIVKDYSDNVILDTDSLSVIQQKSVHKRMRVAINETYPPGQHNFV